MIRSRYSLSLVLLLLLLGALMPQGIVHRDIAHFTHQWDKALHVTAFCVLTLLFAHRKTMKRRVFIGLMLFGLLIEILQILVPSHEISFYDILANCTGIGSGFGLLWLAKKVTSKSATDQVDE